jgi:hypothetical protein
LPTHILIPQNEVPLQHTLFNGCGASAAMEAKKTANR